MNNAADRYFVGNAQLLRKLIMVETALSANTKIVIPANTELVNVIGDMAGILPLGRTAMPLKQAPAPAGGVPAGHS